MAPRTRHFKTTIVGDEPCPQCRENGRDKTGNHLIRFSDGSGYCNRCKYREPPTESGMPLEAPESLSVETSHSTGTLPFLLPFTALRSRLLSEATCRRFGVKVSYNPETGEEASHYYPYIYNNNILGYKIRGLPKSFTFHRYGLDVPSSLLGSSFDDLNSFLSLFPNSSLDDFRSVKKDKRKSRLFGDHLKTAKKKVLIVGGELDALSAYQMLKERYPNLEPAVVSLPNGENLGGIEDSLDYLESFSEVIICTDMDEVGRKCAFDLCNLIGYEKSKVMQLPLKDPSEMLMAGRADEFISAYFSAKEPRPESIVMGSDFTLEDLKTPMEEGFGLPYPKLNLMLKGLRKGEITTLTAGSGIGKSTLAREIAYSLNHDHQLRIGAIFLEEDIKKTALSMIAIHNNVPLPALRLDPTLISEEDFNNSFNKLINNDRWFAVNHFGSLTQESLLQKMRYFATIKKVDFIILDHLSMIFSGQASSNERKDIDLLMTDLAAFTKATGVGIIVIVHLSRDKYKTSYNEGGEVSLTDLRGSAALEQLSWNVIALERNQQSQTESDISQIRILKNREWGNTGVADRCKYHHETGRLLPYEEAGSF